MKVIRMNFYRENTRQFSLSNRKQITVGWCEKRNVTMKTG